MNRILEKISLLFGGYGSDGYDRHGFDRNGIDKEGYNRRGFNRKGKHKLTGTAFDEMGYNAAGFDQDGEHMDYANLKGNRRTLLQEGVIQADLHGMNMKAAIRTLDELLEDDYYRIVIIHGYTHGNNLKRLVRGYELPDGWRMAPIDHEGISIFEREV